MKNTLINKLLLLFLMILGLTACDNREIIKIDKAEAPIMLDLSDTSLFLDANFPDDLALTLSWTPATYSVPTEVKYQVQIAADEGFESPQALGGAINQSVTVATFTTKQMNAAAQALGLEAFVESTLYLRVVAFLGDQAMQQFSNVTPLKITPYKLVYPDFYLVGAASYVGWNAGSAQLLYKQDNLMTIYTYMAKDQGFRFLGQQDWNPINYSIDKDGTRSEYRYFKTTSTNIIQDTGGDENMIFTGDTGIYKVTIDATKGVQALKAIPSAIPEYDFAQLYIVGNVGGNNWTPESAIPMTTIGDGVYEYTVALPADASFKILGQQSWGDLDWGNLGGDGDTGYLAPKGDNGNINFVGDGSDYKITINLKAGTYNIVKQ